MTKRDGESIVDEPAAKKVDAIGGLKECVTALEGSLGTVCSRMSQSLEQSVSMMKNMNSMMEEYVKSSLKLALDFELDRALSTTKILFSVHNACRLPIPNLSLSLCRDDKTQEFNETRQQIEPNETYRQSLQIDDISTVQYFDFSVSFPSPGSGATLTVSRRCKVLKCQQLIFETVEKKEMASEATSIQVPPSVVRTFLSLGELEGLDTSKLYKAQHHDIFGEFHIVQDINVVRVELYGKDESLRTELEIELQNLCSC